MQNLNERTALPSPRLTVAALRRSSPSNYPVTRTLRLSEAEHSSRESTPLHVTLEDLSMRPRSNPRSRTPMRLESPLNPNEFRRESLGSEDELTPTPRRIAVRPLAISATIVNRIREERPVTPKSHKQGPSHRKSRRWNNDHFGSLASELASSSRAVASVLSKAQADAHLYKEIYDPQESESQVFRLFVSESKYQGLRDRFLDGEMPEAEESQSRPEMPAPLTASRMLHRIDPRLRRVVLKAGTNSQPAFLVIKRFEDFVVRAFVANEEASIWDRELFEDLLLEAPTLTAKASDRGLRRTCQFYFHPDSATGGFHRLLLHAICQFHGFHAASKLSDVRIREHTKARALIVTGTLDPDVKFRLVHCLVSDDAEAIEGMMRGLSVDKE